MKLDAKRGFSYLLLLTLIFSIALPIVSAQAEDVLLVWQETIGEGTSLFISDKFGDSATDIIVSIIITLIIFAGIYNILELVSIFDLTWVKLLIAGGITIIGVIFEWVVWITKFGATLAAIFGTIGVILEIIIAVAVFIGLAIGSTKVAAFAAKRKAQAAEIKAIRGAGEAASAIRGLREVQEEFERT